MVELLKLVEQEGIALKEVNFTKMGAEELKGLYLDGKIYLCTTIKSEKERRCILAEELGHHFKSYGNIIDQGNVVNIKQENHGRKWAFEYLVPFEKMICASKQGIRNRYELAEYLNVTEILLSDALNYYRSKYGLYVRNDRYIFYFEPFGVMEILEGL